MDLGLEGMTALVTASSRGLGKAAASALAQEGARLFISSHSPRIHEAAQEIRETHKNEVEALEADLRRPDQIKELVEAALEGLGHIDILILNSGGPAPGGFLELTAADWKEAVDLTLMSAVHVCYEVVPHMLERGSGCIVASQSYSVKQPIDNLVLSNSVRLAVIGLMKSLAAELGPTGIRVNSINPAWTWTERVEQLVQDRAERSGRSSDEEAAEIVASLPLGRMGTVEEYGNTVAWLASPAAGFIHGHALMFDGGGVRATL